MMCANWLAASAERLSDWILQLRSHLKAQPRALSEQKHRLAKAAEGG